eukprot:GFUD01013323.1.p1 GENE.GFUD01013323.1~~GFUD01013323.1.p1  ORF type:complete len:1085 (-),score=369.84 GFUD01013323.1:206-3460(-)
MPRPGSKRSLSPYGRENNDGPRPKNSRPAGDSSVSGIIQRIKLEHFMCHEELDWEPNKNVNFVTGVNGSGKSSVLQGLVLGLLADSKHTKRYNKLQDFIQKGHSRAIVQVTLKNEGEDAYKSEIYGASITFQRTINDNGQSSVFIKDHKQNVVKKATKDAREEGKRILENFRINTDNPIAILQQEEAKELLKVESPENLYTFFQKATLLKQCIDQYSAAKTELEKTRNTIDAKRVQIRELGKQLTLKYEKLKELDKLKERDLEEERLQKEFMWALVKENRVEQEKLTSKMGQKETALENPKEKLKSLHTVKVQLDNQMTKQVDKAEQERGQYAREERELTELKIETERLKEEEKKIKADIKGYDSMRKTLDGEIRIMKEQLEQLSSSQNSKDKVKLAKERQKKLNKLEDSKSGINEEIEKKGTERDDIESQQDGNRKELEKIEYERKGCQRKVEHLESELAEMVGMGDQKLAVFDRLAPKVAEEIRSAAKRQQFRICPLGPVGSHIKLTAEAASNSALARLLETELGTNQVKAYLCNDDQDRRVLWDIFNRVYGGQKKPQIFTSKFLTRKHDVRRVERYNTVMDYLEITGSPQEATVIFNHLVDQKSIESVVVCKAQDEAKQICTFHQNVPRNMNYAITHDFNRFFPPTSNTSYRSYYIDPKTSQMLGANMSNKVEEKKSEILRTRTAMQEINANSEVVLRTKTNLKMQNDEIRSRITELRGRLAKISSEKSQLKAEEDSVDNMETVQDKLEEKKVEYDHLCELQDTKLNEKDKVGNLIKEKGSVFARKSKVVAKLRESTNPIEREISKIEGQISSKKKEISNQEKVVKRYQNEVAQLKRELKEKEGEEKRFLGQAKQKAGSEYVEPSGTVMQLNAKIKQIRETKKKSSKVVADREKLLEEYRVLKEQYETQKRKIANIEDHVKMMEDMNTARNDNYLFIRKTISNIIQRRFAMLSESFSRQFGTQIFININHKRRELNFIFKNSDGDAISTEINSLSGGEKSYAQMCLIASLWENMNPPFRALDEWDVFLDALNRKNISSKLLEFGLTKLDYQFIFISPQGASDIVCDPSEKHRVSIMEIKKN